MKKNVIALMLTIVMLVGSIGGSSAFAAEAMDESSTTEIAVEETAGEDLAVPETADEEADIREEQEELSEVTGPEQTEDVQDDAPNSEQVEDSTEAVTEETVEPATEEPSFQEEAEEIIDEDEQEQDEENREAEVGSITGDNVVQAIWTKGNTTFTFYYGPLVSEGDSFKGETVTNVWSGTDVIDSPEDGTREWGYYWDENDCPLNTTCVVFDSSFFVVKPRDTSFWFSSFSKLRTLDLSGLDTSNVTYMTCMFRNCGSLTSLDLSGFNTSNVEGMSGMFSGCSGLTNLTLGRFDTSNVDYMNSMFKGCRGLTSLDLSRFNTSGVKGMKEMFRDCSSLMSLDLSGFDTSNVWDMERMFEGCTSLTSLDLSGFDTSNVESMEGMFSNCTSLTSLDLSGFETSKVKGNAVGGMDYMFSNCTSLTSLDLSSFDTSSVTGMNGMFNRCKSLTSLDLSGFDLSSISYTLWGTGLDDVFYECENLKTIYCADSTTDWSSIAEAEHIFYRCFALVGEDGDTQVAYPDHSIDISMAKSASLGGYFTPKPLNVFFAPVKPKQYLNKDFFFRSELKSADSIKYKFDYNDDWVFSNNEEDRYKLMKTSIRVAMAAYGAKDDKGYGPKNIKKMMDTMGFKYTNDSVEYPKPTKNNVNTIGSAIGLKNLEMSDGSTKSIILVAVRGGGYETEWGGNFRVGGDLKNSVGFNSAADQVGTRLQMFIKQNRQYISDDLRIWITGYSRAAATSNLVAAKLIDKSIKCEGVSPDEVMAFCFECPNTTTDRNAYNKAYNNIINIVNPNDFVPKVPLHFWGFRKYGITLYIPCWETTSNYQTKYYNPMCAEYTKIFDNNNIDYNYDVIAERRAGLAGQASLFDRFFDHLGLFIPRGVYFGICEDSLVDIAGSTLGEQGDPDWVSAIPAMLDILITAAWIPIATGHVLEAFTVGNPSGGASAHYAELCMSWIDALGSYQEYYLVNNSFYRVYIINCPVEVIVRDSEGTVVGHIVDNEVEEIEDGIVARTDENGQKLFFLPSDEEYSIDIKATDDGEVNCTVEEFNYDSFTTEKVINYKSIEVKAGDELLGTATEILENNEAEYTLQHAGNGEVIAPDEILTGDEVVEYTVEVASNGNGTVAGGGLYVKGEFAQVTATIEEGNEFEGWYVDGERVSEEPEYRFAVENDLKLEARFSKKVVDFRGKTTRGDMFNLANNVKVTWKEVPGAKYYKVYREGIMDPNETQTEPVIVTERLIGWDKEPGLTNGHAYRYKIVASLTGKGDSSGDSPLLYSKIMYRLKTVVIRSVKNTAPGKVTVKYDKTTSGDSYVLQYSENKDMTNAKTKVVLGANNTSYVIGGLKKGKTYYISIRVRKKVNGIDYYTTFGVPKKITITK